MLSPVSNRSFFCSGDLSNSKFLYLSLLLTGLGFDSAKFSDLFLGDTYLAVGEFSSLFSVLF